MLETTFKRTKTPEANLELEQGDSLLIIKENRECLLVRPDCEEKTPFQKSTQVILETIAYMLTNEDLELMDLIEQKYNAICKDMIERETLH